jgi:LysR family transcriptional regulator (chromosome initiation inhibitor)
VDLDLMQLRALSAVADAGTLEAAASRLHVTPSAVSQRLKALETAAGRVLLVRSKPVRLTPSGETVVRLARQIDLLTADTAALLGSDAKPGRPPTLPIAVNADSLATWILPTLAPLADTVAFDLRCDDESHTSALLRDGTVMGAVTTQADPVSGCSVRRLGTLRYRPVASPAFVDRWFPDGAGRTAMTSAPMLVFDRKDTLQHRYLRQRHRTFLDPPTHAVPASSQFVAAIVAGFGWGLLPRLQSREMLDAGTLVEFDRRGAVDVTLYWQQWKLRSPALDRVADAVRAGAETYLADAPHGGSGERA